MKEKHKKSLMYLGYTLIVLLIFFFFGWLGHFGTFKTFITSIEQSTFDLRQILITKYKKPNKDIVILAVDGATYEYIMDKYGYWPISRQVWADVVNGIEKTNPKYIIFDMLFVKPNLADIQADNAFVQSVKNNNNVYLSMNFDNYEDAIRQSQNLNPKFKLNVKEGNLDDNGFVTFINSRMVMEDLAKATKNIGIVNINRDQDGIIRNTTPIFKYKKNYYPNLSLRVAMDYLGVDSVSIIDNNLVLDEKHKIPLDMTHRAILNWYGANGTYKHIPLWTVVRAIKDGNSKFLKENFENKIIYVGTTATGLSDIKSVPVEPHLAGVELHTTFLNNILDNSFITKTSIEFDFIVSILLSLIVGYLVLKTQSVLKTFLFLFGVMAFYTILSVYVMLFFKLWIPIFLPYITMIATFVLVYCEKYLLKSKDYEQTYKLAVTDGLTQIFNHRYFQEQMIIHTDNYNRYGVIFSLVLIDIDFFKKFNDTYGHQSGDCVLKQVAAILKKSSRISDVVCRYGGEEMSVILTNTNKQEAIIVANKICSAVRNNKFTLANGEKVNVTISVGVASIGIDGNTPQEVIEYSDKCLYKAKESGRNRVSYDA